MPTPADERGHIGSEIGYSDPEPCNFPLLPPKAEVQQTSSRDSSPRQEQRKPSGAATSVVPWNSVLLDRHWEPALRLGEGVRKWASLRGWLPEVDWTFEIAQTVLSGASNCKRAAASSGWVGERTQTVDQLWAHHGFTSADVGARKLGLIRGNGQIVAGALLHVLY